MNTVENTVSENGIFSRKLYEYSGFGRVVYTNSFEVDADFSVQMLQNGNITGELNFH